MKTRYLPVTISTLLLALVGHSTANAQTPVSFSGPLSYLGNSPAVADFNADGIPDLATVDQTTSEIHIHSGVGNGTFTGDRVIDLAALDGAAFNILLATTDLNLDGIPDLVVGARGQRGFFVITLLGKTGGGFSPPLPLLPELDLSNFYVADLNGDGQPDLILLGSFSTIVLLGKGDGTFETGILAFSGSIPVPSLAVGDFNGDGKPDLAIPLVNGIFVFFGDGTGHFPRGTTFTTTVQFGPIAAADVNGDGKQDLIVEANEKGLLEVLPGDGHGGFGTPDIYFIGKSGGYDPSIGLAIGDVNGDGIPDIVTPDPAVLIGKGDGTFALPVLYPANASWRSVQLVDLRGNGQLDIVANVYPGSDYNTTVLLNAGSGLFQDGVNVQLNGKLATCLAVADFNGDGHDDVAIGVGANVEILLGTGRAKAAVRPSSIISLPSVYGACPLSGDFNHDGLADLLVRSGPTGFFYLAGLGNGTFAAPVLIKQNFSSLVVGDFNGDGTLDIAGESGSQIDVLQGDGTGAFSPYASLPAPLGSDSLTAADLNGDGRTDLVATSRNGDTSGFTVYLSAGAGSFTSQVFPMPNGSNPNSVIIADVNQDGVPDLVIVGSTSFVFLGEGAGMFGPASQLGVSGNSGAVADLNGDGFPDLIVIDNYQAKVFLGNGLGAFSFPENPDGLWFAPPGPASIAVAYLQSQTPSSGFADLITVGTSLNGSFADLLLNRDVPH